MSPTRYHRGATMVITHQSAGAIVIVCAAALATSGRPGAAQTPSPHVAAVQRIADHPKLEVAMDTIDRQHDRLVADIVALTEIPAPPFKEDARGAAYLKMLREWGVYNLLRSSEEVVRIDERPELGIRRRIAVGIHAGAQPLGTIWVQEGDQPLTEQAERALLGAARVTAPHLIQQRNQPTSRFRESLHGLGAVRGHLSQSGRAKVT